MTSTEHVRFATEADADGMLAIYAPIVRDTPISFELEPPSLEAMRERIAATAKALPWLVSEAGGRVLGYAYASRHRERPAYRWAVDVSVYVGPEARGRGVARRLYAPLLGLVRDMGYARALAGIALPNAASVGLHEAFGFRGIGVFERVGYKLGAWHDVGWWQLDLVGSDENPREPRTVAELVAGGGARRHVPS
jgi:phosphinothricin acetyltransferase